jgi:transposase-like protein
MGFTASDTAKLTNISVRSINTIYIKLRKKIAVQCEEISPFNGIVELDESYFGVRGKLGRWASGKTIVFGLLKRDGNVYTKIVPDCSKAKL